MTARIQNLSSYMTHSHIVTLDSLQNTDHFNCIFIVLLAYHIWSNMDEIYNKTSITLEIEVV